MYYSLLSSLPLLQGIGADVLLDWQERHVMRIVSVERDEGVVIGQGEYCRTLAMLMEGEMECCLKTGDWELYETISAGQVIEEEAVWSLSQRYARSYRATTNARMLVVSREHVMRTLMQNEIFRINLLGRMAARLEKRNMAALDCITSTVEEHIMGFVRRIQLNAGGEKVLNIKLEKLADIVRETRLNVSRTLHRMQDEGKIRMKRERIVFLK